MARLLFFRRYRYGSAFGDTTVSLVIQVIDINVCEKNKLRLCRNHYNYITSYLSFITKGKQFQF